MNLIYAITYAIEEAIGTTIDKFNVDRNHIAARQLMLLVFGGMTGSLLIYILLLRPSLPDFTMATIILLLAIALVSFAGNILDYVSLKFDDLALREPMLNLEPVFAGFVGYILFPKERKVIYLIAFALSIIIVAWGTDRRDQKGFEKKGMTFLLLGVACYSILPSIYKFTLPHVSAVYIAFFRTASILILGLIFFRGFSRYKYTKSKVGLGLTSGVIYSTETVLGLIAISKLGVIETMLVTMITPGLIYLSSYFLLHEKVKRREVISSGLMALVVLSALVI